MFRRVLVANRGEIACRVITALQRLGIHAIAVYSDADAGARHVRLADEAHRLGPAPAAESYLDIERVLGVARRWQAEAIHPGYGFLSENEDFAAACERAGIAFVGPRADAIRRMGLKHEAKALVAAAGVPVIPGYLGERQDESTLLAEGRRVGFPLLVKAVAGGGGRGMRVAHGAADLPEALAAARSEATSAFGDGRVMLERFVERPRHVEVQVFGDTQGSHVHLFERECSVQRRYQKIIEESPSPAMDAALRGRMAAAAVRAAAAVDYVNAGTIEFILAPDGAFFFMEMNTRLQVEHPVTELVTGIDLVEWQLRIAAGEPLPLAQHEIVQRGHAIEARLCCEDPQRGFLPSAGMVERFAFPPEGPGWRMDRGLDDGDTVPVHYDAMVAKAIAWAPDRPQALARLRHNLARTALFGPRSNLQLLRRLLAHPAFVAGEVDTTFVDRNLDELLRPLAPPSRAALVAIADHARGQGPAAESTPWSRDGWQANGQGGGTIGLGGTPVRRLRVRAADGKLAVREGADSWSAGVESLPDQSLAITLDGARTEVALVGHGNHCVVTEDSVTHEIELTQPWPRRTLTAEAAGHPTSPLPGRVVALPVAVGDAVEPGQVLAVVEGMKMQVPVKAPRSGRVTRLLVAQGDMVDAEATLLELADP
jgi:3-methylcrotonyl-CoA carboxylase alpha subunit